MKAKFFLVAVFFSVFLNASSGDTDHSTCYPYNALSNMFEIRSDNESVFIPYEIIDGKIINGDVILHPDASKRAYMISRKLWNKNTLGQLHVPYKFASEFTDEQKTSYSSQLQKWQDRVTPCNGSNLCAPLLNIYEAPDISSGEYLRFTKGTSTTGCAGSVGSWAPSSIYTKADGNCNNGLTSIIHEFGHILGYHHEQSRPDRDSYIDINWCNIDEASRIGYLPFGIKNYVGNTFAMHDRYDNLSALHYPAGSIKPTMISKFPTIFPMQPNTNSYKCGPTNKDVSAYMCVYHNICLPTEWGVGEEVKITNIPKSEASSEPSSEPLTISLCEMSYDSTSCSERQTYSNCNSKYVAGVDYIARNQGDTYSLTILKHLKNKRLRFKFMGKQLYYFSAPFETKPVGLGTGELTKTIKQGKSIAQVTWQKDLITVSSSSSATAPKVDIVVLNANNTEIYTAKNIPNKGIFNNLTIGLNIQATPFTGILVRNSKNKKISVSSQYFSTINPIEVENLTNNFIWYNDSTKKIKWDLINTGNRVRILVCSNGCFTVASDVTLTTGEMDVYLGANVPKSALGHIRIEGLNIKNVIKSDYFVVMNKPLLEEEK